MLLFLAVLVSFDVPRSAGNFGKSYLGLGLGTEASDLPGETFRGSSRAHLKGNDQTWPMRQVWELELPYLAR